MLGMRQQKSDFIIEQMIRLMDIAQRQKWLRYGHTNFEPNHPAPFGKGVYVSRLIHKLVFYFYILYYFNTSSRHSTKWDCSKCMESLLHLNPS